MRLRTQPLGPSSHAGEPAGGAAEVGGGPSASAESLPDAGPGVRELPPAPFLPADLLSHSECRQTHPQAAEAPPLGLAESGVSGPDMESRKMFQKINLCSKIEPVSRLYVGRPVLFCTRILGPGAC